MTKKNDVMILDNRKVRTNGIFYLFHSSQFPDFIYILSKLSKIDVVYIEGIAVEMLRLLSRHPRHGELIASYIKG